VAAVCRSSDTRGIGIDIEELVSSDTAKQLQSQVLYGEEGLLLAGERKTLIFTLAFSKQHILQYGNILILTRFQLLILNRLRLKRIHMCVVPLV
jgi:hypothetical protein